MGQRASVVLQALIWTRIQTASQISKEETPLCTCVVRLQHEMKRISNFLESLCILMLVLNKNACFSVLVFAESCVKLHSACIPLVTSLLTGLATKLQVNTLVHIRGRMRGFTPNFAVIPSLQGGTVGQRARSCLAAKNRQLCRSMTHQPQGSAAWLRLPNPRRHISLSISCNTISFCACFASHRFAIVLLTFSSCRARPPPLTLTVPQPGGLE